MEHTHNNEGKERIAKFLARAGVASRREAERLILERLVKVNGVTLDTPAFLVDGSESIEVMGKKVGSAQEVRMWLYHKPTGLLTTHDDPDGRPTVFSALPAHMPRVVSVGRLDMNSEGLLLLTTSGDLAGKLGHPSLGWLRRYRARVHGAPSEKAMERLRQGVTIEGIHYAPAEVTLERKQGSNAWISVGVREGKNREVRKMLEFIECPVNRLIRVAFGPFELGELPRGAIQEVPQAKIKRLVQEITAKG